MSLDSIPRPSRQKVLLCLRWLRRATAAGAVHTATGVRGVPLTAAVHGARVSLARHDRGREAFGLAPYVDFHATEGDWAAYRSGWGTP